MKHGLLMVVVALLNTVVSQQPRRPAPPGGVGGGGARPSAPPGAMVQSVGGGGVRGGSFPVIESGQVSGAAGPDIAFSLGSLNPGRGRPSSNNRFSWNRKLIYNENCGSWLTVRYDECPVAFEDPRFNNHNMFCK